MTTRREFLRDSLTLLGGPGLLSMMGRNRRTARAGEALATPGPAPGPAGGPAPAARRPNLVLILADDLGYGDVSCYNPDAKFRTPHLDRMAAEGIRFTDAHSPSALCTPTRYGILTGRYCWRSRLKKGVLGALADHLIEPERMTLASMLKSQGYHTACIGKWHLGMDWQDRDDARPDAPDVERVDFTKPIRNGPNTVGFDWFYGISASLDMAPYCYIENDRVIEAPTEWTAGSPWNAFWREGPIAPGFRHVDVLPHLTEKATAYIRARAGAPAQPFFLYFALPAPHTPVVPLPEFRGLSGAGDYGDFCIQVDHVVGRVMQALKDAGFDENTVVIFTSDNGPERIAYNRLRDYNHASMGPWRGVKRDTWEGGHRVPFIVRWPSALPGGQVSEQVITLTDMMATIAEIVGFDLPASAAEDSLSFLPALIGGVVDTSRREAIVYHAGSGEFAIRRGDWVLIDAPSGTDRNEPAWYRALRGYRPHGQPKELYNLREDPTQRDNLFNAEPEIAGELQSLLMRYRESERSVSRAGA